MQYCNTCMAMEVYTCTYSTGAILQYHIPVPVPLAWFVAAFGRLMMLGESQFTTVLETWCVFSPCRVSFQLVFVVCLALNSPDLFVVGCRSSGTEAVHGSRQQ